MTIAYTVILSGWDHLRPPEVVEPGVRYICYTDQPADPVPPWEFQPAFVPFSSASRNSRLPKILPHLHFEADYSIYHDANFTLKMEPSRLVVLLAGADIAMLAHPERSRVDEEADVIMGSPDDFPTVDMDDVRAQVTRWKHAGAPLGLWAAGLIIRRHTESVERFNELWWGEYIGGSSRDQLALPSAMDRAGIEIQTLRANIFENPWIQFHWHAAWKHRPENQMYATARARLEWRRKRLEEICALEAAR